MTKMSSPKMMMVTFAAASALVAMALPGLASAENCYDKKQDAKTNGAVLGAVAGAAIGGSASNTHNKGSGAVLGAIVGAAVGSSIAKNNTTCGYDRNGYAYNDGGRYDDRGYVRGGVVIDERTSVYHHDDRRDYRDDRRDDHRDDRHDDRDDHRNW